MRDVTPSVARWVEMLEIVPGTRMANDHSREPRQPNAPKYQRAPLRELSCAHIRRFEAAWKKLEAMGDALHWSAEDYVAQFDHQNFVLKHRVLGQLCDGQYAGDVRPGKVVGMLNAMGKVVAAQADAYERAAQQQGLEAPMDMTVLKEEIASLHAAIEKDMPRPSRLVHHAVGPRHL